LTWTGPAESISSSTTRILEGRQSGRIQDVLLIQTYSDWYKLAQAECKTFYSFKPFQTGSNWLRQGARCFTHSNLVRQAHTGSGRMQDVLLSQTYSDWFILVQAGCKMFYSFKPIQTGSYWFRQDARCKMFYSFKHIQTGSYWFRQDTRCFTHSNHWFKLVQAGCKMFYFITPIQTGSNWFR
jgi:hypothetical protein